MKRNKELTLKEYFFSNKSFYVKLVAFGFDFA